MKKSVYFALGIFLLACTASPDRIIIQNPPDLNPNPNIIPETEFRLGVLNERGQTTLRIPLTHFAPSETELDTATLDIYVAQEKYIQDMAVAEYYHETGQVITFTIPGSASLSKLTKSLDVSDGFAAGTTLGFALHTSNGETNYYQGKVSAIGGTIASEAQASEVLPPEPPAEI